MPFGCLNVISKPPQLAVLSSQSGTSQSLVVLTENLDGFGKEPSYRTGCESDRRMLGGHSGSRNILVSGVIRTAVSR